MTKTNQSTNRRPEPQPEIFIEELIGLIPLTALVGILFLLLLLWEQSGFWNLFEVLPLWLKYTWTAGAYICCFLATRFIGIDIGTRKKKASAVASNLERQLLVSRNFYAVLAALGLTFCLQTGASVMAPDRINIVAVILMPLPMIIGLVCADRFGYFRLHLKDVTIVF